MKKIILFTLISITTNFAFSQDSFFEMMKFPKVVINKNHVAYTLSYVVKKNGVKSEIKTNNPNVNNPYKIRILSNENNGK